MLLNKVLVYNFYENNILVDSLQLSEFKSLFTAAICNIINNKNCFYVASNYYELHNFMYTIDYVYLTRADFVALTAH